MELVNLRTNTEYLQRVLDILNGFKDSEYLLLLSGGNSPMPLYNHLSFNFDYPFPKDVGLVDERWGNYSQHEHSTELFIKNSGLIGRTKWVNSTFHPILSVKPLEAEREAASYEQVLLKLTELYEGRVVAVMGMSLDGHTAGILPNSPAVDSERFVIAYDSDDIYKKRITITMKYIMEKISKVILILNTDEKCGIFNRIMDFETDVRKYPVLVYKHMPDVTVFCFSEKNSI